MMKLTVEIFTAGEPPPAGSPVLVEIRDAGLQDASSATVAEARTRSRKCPAGQPCARAELSLENTDGYPIVWVHVDVDNSGDVSVGDYLTMQSYPVRGEGEMRVEVRRVD